MGLIKDNKKTATKVYSNNPLDMAILAEQYAKKDIHTVTEVLRLIDINMKENEVLNLIKEVKYKSIKASREKHNKTVELEDNNSFISRMEGN